MNSTKPHGAVAAGSKETAQAAHEVLKAGGNAFDAAIAAAWMTFVAEPTMTSAGGGGFMTVHTADRKNIVFDFFSQTPLRKRPPEDLSFFPIRMDYGGTSQSFHVGIGACAVPGNIAGLFHIHEKLGKMPMKHLMAPAIKTAREGLKMSDFFVRCVNLVRPAFITSDSGRALFQPKYRDLRKGDIFRNVNFADTMEAMAHEGPDEFYRGEIAELIAKDSEMDGGYLTKEDMEQYRVIEREPLTMPYLDHLLVTNPPPSAGGALIAYTLKLLENEPIKEYGFGSKEHLQLMANAMRLTRVERKRRFDDHFYDSDVIEKFFNSEDLEELRQVLKQSVDKIGTTTHFTVADSNNNVASLTSSVGEGSGYVVPKTGIMMNNMLGEEDLNPHGFHNWKENQRMTSMMAPTLVLKNGMPVIATGTGGANRIRSVIAQVVSNHLRFGMHPEETIEAPRLHWEFDKLDFEPGFKRELVEKVTTPDALQKIAWSQKAFYFGGAHSIFFDDKGNITPVADSRREGKALSL